MPKQVRRFLGAVVTIACATAVPGAEIHFRGASEQDGKLLLLLKHSHFPSQLEWVAVGGMFRGYSVTSYDSSRGVVRLQKSDHALAAALAGAPAKIPPEWSSAREVVEKAGARCCAVHGGPLIETSGYGLLSGVSACGRPDFPVLLAVAKRRAEFPNTLGEGLQREESEFYRVEIVREHCPQCDAAYKRCLAQVNATDVAGRAGPIPSPFR